MSCSNGKNNETIRGVGCDVVSCRYHGKDNCCCAGCIQVGSTNAIRKGETYCGTFEPKASM